MWRRRALYLGLICASPLLAQSAVVNGVPAQSVVADSCLAVAAITNSDGTITVSNASGTYTLSLNRAHANAWSVTPTASSSAILFNGFPFTAGTATTNWPEVLLQPAGTTSTVWSTLGTYFGVNAASGFTGNLMDLQTNGVHAFQVSAAGSATAAGTLSGNAISATGNATANRYLTVSNCTSGTSPAVCASANSGAVALPTGTGSTLTINTTAVTATSRIPLTIDSSLTVTSTTCNTTLATLTGTPLAITGRVAGTSFTVATSASTVISTNPICFSYMIFN